VFLGSRPAAAPLFLWGRTPSTWNRSARKKTGMAGGPTTTGAAEHQSACRHPAEVTHGRSSSGGCQAELRPSRTASPAAWPAGRRGDEPLQRLRGSDVGNRTAAMPGTACQVTAALGHGSAPCAAEAQRKPNRRPGPENRSRPWNGPCAVESRGRGSSSTVMPGRPWRRPISDGRSGMGAGSLYPRRCETRGSRASVGHGTEDWRPAGSGGSSPSCRPRGVKRRVVPGAPRPGGRRSMGLGRGGGDHDRVHQTVGRNLMETSSAGVVDWGRP